MVNPSAPRAHTEGESNTSQARAAWRARNDDAPTRALIERDAEVFLHQSLSSPVLCAIAKAEGIWIEDINARLARGEKP